MIQWVAEHIGPLRLAGRQRGGVALIMVVGFMGLAVPLAVASMETAGQLSRNSRVYDGRLSSMYSAGAGIEVALWEILNDPDFDDELSEQSQGDGDWVGENRVDQIDIQGDGEIEEATAGIADHEGPGAAEGYGKVYRVQELKSGKVSIVIHVDEATLTAGDCIKWGKVN